jgi:hypothetical protein
VKTLTTDLLVEAEQPPVVVEVEFPPVVELEEAVLTVGPPVLAALLCSTTTQLPKPDPEINCYDKSAKSEKNNDHVVENLLQDTYYSCTLSQKGVEL